ncbi:uncharacterized protein LOC133874619 [Alnus glutinosa]|uniref:uncharacterized protein LOC133874619 n=1 Tax=Alnus glutinosa TaxID=3517 RepID=UPI002D7651CB|nr:uncharacterized protein LOC133874619 [Alnus glutinosa]
MSTLQRPNRHSVVCMAKKYASNTDKRKKLSRKKGGNSNRKKKSRRKGRKKGGNSDRKKKRRMKWGKKKVFKIVRLVSTAATGVVYTMKKSSKITDKLQQLKYDPRVKRHVLFEEVN